ncbi:cyclic nucleotide-gated cation channel subunit A [Ctenocephalides felis]|uniref:cyclic nucleotide-gated cation channel subunit A n=1 Tax=Ctenocephalides felis TaxID=7515 RepID=UPI000E6E340F|nr:cyclic nucleotide-gated cation channel subunit A [Ctenocephalides felis]
MARPRGDAMRGDGQAASHTRDGYVASRAGSGVIIGSRADEVANSNGGVTGVAAKPHGGFMYTPPANIRSSVSTIELSTSQMNLSQVSNHLQPSSLNSSHPDKSTNSTALCMDGEAISDTPNQNIQNEESRASRWYQEFRTFISERILPKGSVKSAAKAPDWFLDKFSRSRRASRFSQDNKNQNNEDATVICGYPLVVDTTLNSHYRWLALVSLAVLYNIIFVVGRAVFWEINNKIPAFWFTMDYFCDLIYWLDVAVHAHEGYLDQGLMVRDSSKLRSHYIASGSWRLDLLSLLPTDIMYIWWQPSTCQLRVPCPVIVRLNRLLRAPRMWEWFDRTETATGYPNAFRICKVLIAILILIHWNACLYFAISYGLGFGTDHWVYNLNGPRNSSLSRQYIYSFYWSTLTLTTIGETPTPENDAEYLFVVCDFLAGVLIFATIVGNIGSMISNMNVAKVDFQNRMDGVKQYMAFRKISGELEARVIRWFAYTWSQSGALDEEKVLSALPDKLKAEIAIVVHMETLRKVTIFQDCEPGLLEALVLKLRLQIFSPADYICRKGDVGKEMYIVKRGTLTVVGDDGVTVLATLSAGSVFGELSVLEISGNRTGNRRSANVKSLGYSDLFCLAKKDLWEVLENYQEAKEMLIEKGVELLRKDGLLDEQALERSRRGKDSLKHEVDKLGQTVDSLGTRLARLMAECSAAQAKLKQRLTRLENKQKLQSSEEELTDISASARSRLRSLQDRRRPGSLSANMYSKKNTM